MTVVPTAYLGGISYFTKEVIYGTCILEGCESFGKTSFRNRCTLRDINGRVIRLTIPVQREGHKQETREVRISYQAKWQSEHWHAIESCYGKKPYFLYYADYLKPFYEQQFEYLWELNYGLTATIAGLIRNEPIRTIPPVQMTENWAGQSWEKATWNNELSILDILFEKGPEMVIVN
jgi:hypothetical protein